MAHNKRFRGLIGALAILSLVALASRAESAGHNGYVQHNLVSSGMSFYQATTSDPFLLNPWGIAFLPGGPFWIADNNKGFSTLYDGMGNIESPSLPERRHLRRPHAGVQSTSPTTD